MRPPSTLLTADVSMPSELIAPLDHLLRCDRIDAEAVGGGQFHQPVDLQGEDVAKRRPPARRAGRRRARRCRPGRRRRRATTISSRQPRPIGSTRPSRRVPPSSIEAKTMPPKISSSGWARKMTQSDGEAEPEPDACPFQLVPDDRIAKLRSARAARCRLRARRRSLAPDSPPAPPAPGDRRGASFPLGRRAAR